MPRRAERWLLERLGRDPAPVKTAVLLTLALSATAHAALPRASFIGPKAKPPAKVLRIVTLAPSITDIVLAVGAGERLVGVSRFDERPEVEKIARVGGFTDPSVEAIVGLKPDLLIAQPGPGNKAPVEKVASLGIPVLLVTLQDVEAVLVALREVGRVVGKAEEGEKLARQLEETRASIRKRAAALPKKRVLFVYGFDPLIGAGPGSFADELLRDAGGVNVIQPPAGAYVAWSAESAIASKTDVVVNAANPDNGIEKFKTLPGLRDARWVKVPGRELMHPGPSLARGLEDLFVLVHGSADAGNRP